MKPKTRKELLAFKLGIKWCEIYLNCQNKLKKPLIVDTKTFKKVCKNYKRGF